MFEKQTYPERKKSECSNKKRACETTSEQTRRSSATVVPAPCVFGWTLDPFKPAEAEAETSRKLPLIARSTGDDGDELPPKLDDDDDDDGEDEEDEEGMECSKMAGRSEGDADTV
jgi:hypothetical protein